MDAAPTHLNAMPESVQSKLAAVRRRERGISIFSGLIKAGIGLLVLVVLAMMVDARFIIFSPAVRWAIAIGTLVLVLAGCCFWLIRPLLQRRQLEAVARTVDSAVPQLEERWSTVASIGSRADALGAGSPSLVRQVMMEAEGYVPQVEAKQVVSRQSVRLPGIILGVMLGVLALWFAMDSERVGVLLRRLLFPGAQISLTQISASPGDAVVPRGEPLTLSATMGGRAASDGQLMIRSESGAARTVELKAIEGLLSYDAGTMREAMEYRFRAGDGQTRWHQITVVDRPKITAVKFQLTPPEYTKLPLVEETALPRTTRAIRGTVLRVGFQIDQPLQFAQLQIEGSPPREFTATADGWNSFETTLEERTTFSPYFENEHRLACKSRPTCTVIVYDDLAPNVEIMRPSGSPVSVQGDDPINVEIRGEDDFGIEKIELVVTEQIPGEEPRETVIDVPLGDQAGETTIEKSVLVDLDRLDLHEDSLVSLSVRATDNREIPEPSEQVPPPVTEQQGGIPEQPQPDQQPQASEQPQPDQQPQASEQPQPGQQPQPG
ncbi:MAG: hypothetical protein O3C21_11195, partial [Verrucomicrobia bacterium]|nr:hypothetical protein [Verrucomicrobiota bacterium]